MYSEKKFKNYIFWVQVRRVVVIIILSCIGAALGVLIGEILESAAQIKSFNNGIIIISTIIFFLLSILLTIGTGKQVQDGYWKIAVLRKLTVIQKGLELNNELLKNSDTSTKSKLDSIIKEDIDEGEDYEVENTDLYKFDEKAEKALVPTKNSKNKKAKSKNKTKTLKKPEEITN